MCRLTIASSPPCARIAEPVTAGVPLPEGWCHNPAALALEDDAGRVQPLQTAVLARWADGSVKWLLADFLGRCGEDGRAAYVLKPLATRRAPEGVTVTEYAETVAVRTGAATFIVGRAGPLVVRGLDAGGQPLAAGRAGLVVVYANGRRKAARMSLVAIESRGPIRASLRLDGRCGSGRETLEVSARLTFWKDSPVFEMAVTIRNPQRARHPGGYWELGDRGSILIREASIEIELQAAADVAVDCSPEPLQPAGRMELPFGIHQDSTRRGYVLRSGGEESSGLRADPIVRCSWERGEVSVAMPQFWQHFPRSIDISRGTIKAGLFARHAEPHELQGGEQKTHTLLVAVGRDRSTDLPLDWARARVVPFVEAEWAAASRAVPCLTPMAAEPDDRYRALTSAAIEGPDSFFAKRETADEYGWRNFGDLHADHETIGQAGAVRQSHYNNQYDAVRAFAIQFMRTGDRRWRELALDLARHVTDIDIYHTSRDKSAYNGGMFWHTAHYVDAGRSTHRSYPRHPRVPGGGPANEHNYGSGLLLAYYLTGDPRFSDAVLGLARWVVQMDDGRRTVFRWIDRGATGLASMTRSRDYHGPGRGAAYSVEALLNAYELSGDREWLAVAERLIRRCIHPRDDIPARRLLDAEERWHYTVFLQTLGRYLDLKAARRQLDGMYAYARLSLLAYAEWMAEHEYPYLDTPEKLEYPNETWAAQDLRKAEVFMHASRHSAGSRARYLERAEFFFHTATATLAGMPTRTLTRPMVLLLANGWSRPWFLGAQESAPMPEQPPPAGDPTAFVPQRERALRRARALAAPAAALAAAMLAALGFL